MNIVDIDIVIPCHNEGEGIIKLIGEIEDVIENNKYEYTIVIVDDCSTDGTLAGLGTIQTKGNLKLKILSLPYNIGHQGAIAQGLLFAGSCNASSVIIMDGDGEDDPKAIPQLLSLSENDIVNVIRGKRHEKILFRFSYWVYKMIFRSVTNKKMNFGNYCLLSRKVVDVICSRTFIHLGAFLSTLNFKTTSIVFDRRKRIGGISKMSMISLVNHGFASFVEYAQALLMVFLKLFIVLFILLLITTGYIIYLKFFTDYAILGWTSTIGIGLVTSALLCLGFFITGVLLLNLSQHKISSPPVAIYKVIR
jgi:glycosyltransferase involved in cell wall biosynthesis